MVVELLPASSRATGCALAEVTDQRTGVSAIAKGGVFSTN